jgi:hypothetical protein
MAIFNPLNKYALSGSVPYLVRSKLNPIISRTSGKISRKRLSSFLFIFMRLYILDEKSPKDSTILNGYSAA